MKQRQKKAFVFCEEMNQSFVFNLCLKTLQKFLGADYEVVVLDFDNAVGFIPDKNLKSFLKNTEKCSKNLLFKYIKACVLYCNGGIFIDKPVLLSKNFFLPDKLLLCNRIVVYGNSPYDICSGFMMSAKGNKFLLGYIKQLKKSCMENNAVETLPDELKDNLFVIDAESSGFLIEKALYGVKSDNLQKRLYFSESLSVEEFFEYSKGLTLLNFTGIPDAYKNMSEEEFLSQNILLAQILRSCLTSN